MRDLSDSLFSTFSGNNFLCNNFILCLYLPGQLGAGAVAGITIVVVLVVIFCILSGAIIVYIIISKKKIQNKTVMLLSMYVIGLAVGLLID